MIVAIVPVKVQIKSNPTTMINTLNNEKNKWSYNDKPFYNTGRRRCSSLLSVGTPATGGESGVLGMKNGTLKHSNSFNCNTKHLRLQEPQQQLPQKQQSTFDGQFSYYQNSDDKIEIVDKIETMKANQALGLKGLKKSSDRKKFF
eukprot:Pgem_evm1s13001